MRQLRRQAAFLALPIIQRVSRSTIDDEVSFSSAPVLTGTPDRITPLLDLPKEDATPTGGLLQPLPSCGQEGRRSTRMPIYHLKCALRFKTGHAGTAFDTIAIGADGPEQAVALAELYRCATPGMELSVAVLIDETGAPIWSRRAPSAEGGRGR